MGEIITNTNQLSKSHDSIYSGPMTDLSIIIVSWNTKDLLIKCLESLFLNHPSGTFEVIVVDSASTDNSLEMVGKLFPNVQLIDNEENIGFARANNQGLRLCQGSTLLLLNPDTEVRPGALDAMLDFLNSNPSVGAVGPRVLNPDGSLQHSCSPFPTLGREFLRLFHLPGNRPDGYYRMEFWNQEKPHKVDVLLGACILIRWEVLDQVGLFDENFFMYSEETDLCYRIKHAGWELYWVPQAEIVHYGGKSTEQIAESMFLQLYRSKLQYFRKHHGPQVIALYKILLVIVSLSRQITVLFSWLLPQPRRNNILQWAENYRRLLATLPEM